MLFNHLQNSFYLVKLKTLPIKQFSLPLSPRPWKPPFFSFWIELSNYFRSVWSLCLLSCDWLISLKWHNVFGIYELASQFFSCLGLANTIMCVYMCVNMHLPTHIHAYTRAHTHPSCIVYPIIHWWIQWLPVFGCYK